jgi:hypothetical protein
MLVYHFCRLLGESKFQKDIDGATTVLHLPGTAGSYAETPSFDIRGTSFSVSLWVNLARGGYVYSRWVSPHHFAIVIKATSFILYVYTQPGDKKDTLFK